MLLKINTPALNVACYLLAQCPRLPKCAEHIGVSHNKLTAMYQLLTISKCNANACLKEDTSIGPSLDSYEFWRDTPIK